MQILVNNMGTIPISELLYSGLQEQPMEASQSKGIGLLIIIIVLSLYCCIVVTDIITFYNSMK